MSLGSFRGEEGELDEVLKGETEFRAADGTGVSPPLIRLEVGDGFRHGAGGGDASGQIDDQGVAWIDPMGILDPLVQLPDLRPRIGVAEVFSGKVPEGVAFLDHVNLGTFRKLQFLGVVPLGGVGLDLEGIGRRGFLGPQVRYRERQGHEEAGRHRKGAHPADMQAFGLVHLKPPVRIR